MKMVSFSLFLDYSPPPRPKMPFTYVVNIYSDMSLSYTNNSFVTCSQLSAAFNIGKNMKKRLPENPEFAEMRHDDVILTLK